MSEYTVDMSEIQMDSVSFARCGIPTPSLCPCTDRSSGSWSHTPAIRLRTRGDGDLTTRGPDP